jgi:DNA primase
MDVIMCHQHGIRNVVAVLGTALGAKHISLLRRYADRITLLLDGDKAGQRRTNEVLELFVAGEVDVRIATLPDELDPCEFLEVRTADDFRAMIDDARDAFDHAIQVQTLGIDLVRDTHRANQVLESLLGMIAKSPRLTQGTSTARVLRERQVLARLAREFRVEESMLRQRVAELRVDVPYSRAASAGQTELAPLSARDLHILDAELFEILVRHPELVEAALAVLSAEQLSSGVARQLWEVYKAVTLRGETAEFSRVLGEVSDPRVQNLLVELDERAGSKEAFANTDAPSRLARLIEDLQYRSKATERRRQLATLEQQGLAAADELQLLHQLVQQERKRQGIPAPTDG